MPLRVVQASAAEAEARDEACWSVWHAGLDLPRFCARECVLRRTHAFAQPARHACWHLVEDDGASVGSSCETFTMRASVAWGGRVREGVVFGVASVLTSTHARGRGYASQMLAGVLEWARAQPGSLGAVLYSDVSPLVYERSGFRIPHDRACVACEDARTHTRTHARSQTMASRVGLPGPELPWRAGPLPAWVECPNLTLAQHEWRVPSASLAALVSHPHAHAHVHTREQLDVRVGDGSVRVALLHARPDMEASGVARFVDRHRTASPHVPAVYLHATPEQCAWACAQAEWSHAHVPSKLPPMPFAAARVDSTGASIVWACEWTDRECVEDVLVLYLDAAPDDEASVTALLAATGFAAHSVGRSVVCLWDSCALPLGAVLARVEGAERVLRSSSIPMLTMFAPELAGAQLINTQRVSWL